jgi:predicted ATPase/class 3 adenylate cyclase
MEGRALPTGTVTFLFTDIEGSTRLVQALEGGFNEILDNHHRLLRDVFVSHGGVEVSTEGDAFFVVFSTPAAAVESVVAAQHALNERDWGEGIEVRVRMGLHTGTGTLLGDNYGGLDVHRAARIASAAHGGQVLLSDATRVLVEPSLGSSARAKDLGEHRLKDIERPEHLYQLCIDGLPSDFPPLRSLESRPNNLPISPTTFVTRDRELKEIRELLRGARLLSLTGPGGTGKTRLGLQAATDALFDFKDGVFVVLLAPVTDPELVASTIAETLGVREQGLRPISDNLLEYLEDKEMLLLLDNFEQLLGAAGFVGKLLSAAANVKLLVTSRAALRISGEQEYPVPAMTLPDPARLPPLDMLSQYEAVELFLQRARSVKPDFELTTANAAAIAEICWRLDGLPLPIELAAARIRLFGPKEMLKRLDSALALLTGGARDLPARQRTLRDAIAWSYDLLDEPLQRFFRRLSIFAGGWTFEAADAVSNPRGDLGLDTLDALDTLVENSLVRIYEPNPDHTRFRMLQTIREFGLTLAESHDELEPLLARSAEFFLALAEQEAPKLTADPDSNRALELDHDNLRSALRWSIDRGHAETPLRMGAALWRFWMLRSHLAEGRRWLTDVLELPTDGTLTAERARALMALGSITYWQNDFTATRKEYDEALGLFRKLGDRAGIAEGLYNLGFIDLIDRNPANARRRYEESRTLAQELGDELRMASTTWGLAMAALQERDLEAAMRLGRDAEKRFAALNDWFGLGGARFVYFQVARYGGDYKEAIRLIRDWLDDTALLADATNIHSVLDGLAAVEAEQGQHERALILGGAVAAKQEEYGGGPPPPLVDVVDPRVTAADTLPVDRIEELWAEGRAMSLDEAIAYARKLVESELAQG